MVILILLNLVFILLSLYCFYLFKTELNKKKICTNETRVYVKEVIRRSSNGFNSEYSYILDAPNGKEISIPYESFHPFNEGEYGVIYTNPENIEEFTYSDNLIYKKNMKLIIPIIIEVIIMMATLITIANL